MGNIANLRRLWWGTTLHSSFVVVEVVLPRKPAMANIAGERFWSAPARVSLQVIASGECPAACRTFMHRDRCRVGRTAPIGRLAR